MEEMIEYETPRASVRGVFLCENMAVSHCPIIGTMEYLDYDDVYTDVPTQSGKDVLIF
jgi:hypothetical protein